MNIIDEIRKSLYRMQDLTYRDFQAKLIPTVKKESFIGVRTPQLRAFAKELAGNREIQTFLDDLPHSFFDENQLHAFIISNFKDFEIALEQVKRFLPFVDNWATCDQMSPKAFKKHRQELLPSILTWIDSDQVYTIRFGLGMLMTHYLDEAYDITFPKIVANVRSEAYYVQMMVAWYFATALAKQYDTILPFLEKQKLDPWTHNKAIQKAIESFRITAEQKAYLKKLKIKSM